MCLSTQQRKVESMGKTKIELVWEKSDSPISEVNYKYCKILWLSV